MARRLSLSALLLLSIVLARPTCLAQESTVTFGNPPIARKENLSLKEALERHFESAKPRSLPQFNQAVPGKRVIEQHQWRGARWKDRLLRNRESLPRGSQGSVVLPGILLRPTLPGGAIPTSVVTGDFNRDGHSDFIIANGDTNDLWIYLGNGDGTFQLPRIIPLSKGLSPVLLSNR